jgi:hypothetical protein
LTTAAVKDDGFVIHNSSRLGQAERNCKEKIRKTKKIFLNKRLDKTWILC